MDPINGGLSRPALEKASEILKQGLGRIAGAAVVRFDSGGLDLWLMAGDVSGAEMAPGFRRSLQAIGADPGPVATVALRDCADAPRGWPALCGDRKGWMFFEVQFASGVRDELALRPGGAGADQVVEILHAIWPLLRADCLREVSTLRRAATDALLWTMFRKVGTAALVLDGRGWVVQTNAAGAALLAGRRVLREGPEGLAAAGADQTQALRRALSDCLSREGGAPDLVLLLEDPEGAEALPVILSRFDGIGHEPLVLLLVPQPPDPAQVGMLAQRMGLTRSEARIASLMQLGLPSRETARLAGVKEETFKTYAKRVMAKLHVGSRAELAQRLTWQAGSVLIE